MEYQTIITDKLKEKGLTVQEAAKLCGVTGQTMSVLNDGWKTLPSLAAKVARGLDLKPEEAREIGHVLNRRNWERLENRKFRDVDFRENWWEKIHAHEPEEKVDSFYSRKEATRKQRKDAGIFINVLAVSEWAAGRMTNCNELVKTVTGFDLCVLNGGQPMRARQEAIEKLAAFMHMSVEEITLSHKPQGREAMDVSFLGKLDAIEEAMSNLDVSHGAASRRAGEPATFIDSTWKRAEQMTLFTPKVARRFARALGVDFFQIFQPMWVQKNKPPTQKKKSDTAKPISLEEKRERKKAYMRGYNKKRKEQQEAWWTKSE